MIDDAELKKQLSVEKPIIKGYNFYKSGKVQGIYTKQQEELFYIKSQVKSSYDKQDDKHKNIYTVKIIMDTNSQVQQAVCPCPSGNDGRCNHPAATLFAMEDGCKKSVSTTSESEDDLPCTSKPCTWSIPKKRKQEPSTVQAVKFVKHVYGKKDKECSSSSTVHTTHNEKKSNTDYNALLEKIKVVEEKTGRKLGLYYIIPQQVPEYSTTVTEETPQPSKWDIVSPIKTVPLSMLDIAQKSLRSKTRLYDSIKDRNDITEATKEQHLTRTWYDVRKLRITASKCKRCLIRPTTSPTKAISEVLMYNDRAPTKAMKEGIEAESRIISEFEKDTGLTVHKSGFVISETHPFLGAYQMVSLIIILLWKLRTYKLKKEKVMRMLFADLEYRRRMAVQLKSTRIMVITVKFSNNCFALNLTVVTLLYQVPFQLTEKLLPLTVDFGMIFYQSWRAFTLIISFQNWFTQEFSMVKCDGIKYWNFPARCKDK